MFVVETGEGRTPRLGGSRNDEASLSPPVHLKATLKYNRHGHGKVRINCILYLSFSGRGKGGTGGHPQYPAKGAVAPLDSQ